MCVCVQEDLHLPRSCSTRCAVRIQRTFVCLTRRRRRRRQHHTNTTRSRAHATLAAHISSFVCGTHTRTLAHMHTNKHIQSQADDDRLSIMLVRRRRRPTTNVNGFRSRVALLAHSLAHTGATTSPPDSVVLQRLHSNENECVRECVCVL